MKNFKKILIISSVLFIVITLLLQCTNSNKLSPIFIYDENDLLKISIEDVAKYHGDICPCTVITFRVLQLAISELWRDEIPKRDDFIVISALPSPGSIDTFEFITRVRTRYNGKNFKLEIPTEGKKIRTIKNYVFTIIRKSNGKSITIKVRPNIIPVELFKLRKKIKLDGTATTEDKKKFKKIKNKVKNNFMRLPIKELFEFKIK